MRLLISITNMTSEPLCVCVCLCVGEGSEDLPGNVLGDGNVQMKKTKCSALLNKY